MEVEKIIQTLGLTMKALQDIQLKISSKKGLNILVLFLVGSKSVMNLACFIISKYLIMRKTIAITVTQIRNHNKFTISNITFQGFQKQLMVLNIGMMQPILKLNLLSKDLLKCLVIIKVEELLIIHNNYKIECKDRLLIKVQMEYRMQVTQVSKTLLKTIVFTAAQQFKNKIKKVEIMDHISNLNTNIKPQKIKINYPILLQTIMNLRIS